MQLNHPGRQTYANLGGKLWAPSAVALDLGKHSKLFGVPRAMDEQDIAERGLTLTGGGGMIENLDKLIALRTGMIVTKAENPYEAVAMGTGMSLGNIEKLRRYVASKKR